MSEPNLDRAREAFRRMVDGLHRRQATGRASMAFELSQELVAAAIESAAGEQADAEISEVHLELFPDAAAISARVRVKGRVFPPRPPVDTHLSLKLRDIIAGEAGDSGCVMFRVEEPLRFSSAFADLLVGLLGSLSRKLPVSLDALRSKDALVTVDFAAILRVWRPDLAGDARSARLYALRVRSGAARAEVGFIKA